MNKIAIWEFIPISRHPYTIMGPIFCSWLFMINVTFIVRPSMLKRNLTVKMWAEKNFDTFLNLENYEPLRLPWKIRKNWNHKLQHHIWRPWMRCKWRRLDAHHSGERSPCAASNGNKYPANHGEFSHQLRLWMHPLVDPTWHWPWLIFGWWNPVKEK